MVLQTVVDRFLDGRRLTDLELHELLEGSPELHDRVVTSLDARHLTRRGLRQLIERVPELRPYLGRRLLDRSPHLVDLLEVLQDVPELRQLALEAIATGNASPASILRTARRNPRLREAAVDALLANDRSRERIRLILEDLPGSGDLVAERLRRLGVSDEEVTTLLAAVSKQRESAPRGRQPSPDRQPSPTRQAAPARQAPVREAPPARQRQSSRRSRTASWTGLLGDRAEQELASRAAALGAVPIVGDELVQAASDALAAARREFEAAEARALGLGDEASLADDLAPTDAPTDAPTAGPRADPWRDAPPPPEDALDRRFGTSGERDPGAPPRLD